MATKIEGLPIQAEWVVTAVKEGKETANPNGGGTLKAFYVDFEGAPDVYWRRKMPATVEVGKSYFGTISEGDHGPMFKKETPGGRNNSTGQTSGGARPTGGGREWKPEGQYDPEKVARMGRAHAQGMALTWLEAIGDMPNDLDELWPYVDAFEADVNRAGEAAAQGSTSTATASTTVTASQSPTPPEPEYVLKVCEEAGLSSYPAGKLHAFIVNRLQPEGQVKAVAGLADPQTQVETLDRLKGLYQQAEGEELPPSDPGEDDIPF